MKFTSIKNIIFISILITIIVSCFLLGIWQVNRYFQKQQIQDNDTPSVSTELADSVIEAADLINIQNMDVLIGKTVSIEGSFIPDSNFKLDNRMYNSTYGVELFSLFKLKNTNKVYLVNMGWLEVGNKRNNLTLQFDFSRVHKLNTIIASIPSKPPFINPENFQDDNHQDLWLFVNKEYLITQHEIAIENMLLINLQPTDKLKYREIVKESNAYMHALYAIQWFSFSLFALFGLIKIYK